MTAAKVLAYTLIVRHPDSDVPTPLLAGKTVPKWAKDLVHNDDLVTAADTEENDSDAIVDTDDLAASTVKALREYAFEQEIDLGEASKKDDVIAVIAAEVASRASN